jgi:hypothetical protein
MPLKPMPPRPLEPVAAVASRPMPPPTPPKVELPDRPPAEPQAVEGTYPAEDHPGDPAYLVIAVSTYPRDLRKLDAMVAELKRRGFTRANRSALIRVAIDHVDLDKFPRSP